MSDEIQLSLFLSVKSEVKLGKILDPKTNLSSMDIHENQKRLFRLTEEKKIKGCVKE